MLALTAEELTALGIATFTLTFTVAWWSVRNIMEIRERLAVLEAIVRRLAHPSEKSDEGK